jgi:hypothetical protein
MKQTKQKKILPMVIYGGLCLCLCVCTCVLFLRPKTLEMEGVRVNYTDFNRAYCGKVEERVPVKDCESYSGIEAHLKDIVVTDDGISMTVSVTDDRGEVTEQTLNGKWRNGKKYEVWGVKCVTAVFEVSNDDEWMVLTFNCHNDTKSNNLLLGQVPDEAPHLKFYLQDRAGNIILLEGKLPRWLRIEPDDSWKTDDSDETALIRYVNGLTGANRPR